MPDQSSRPAGDGLAEAKAALLLTLRAKGIRSLPVLRAIEAIPRSRFLPPQHVALALRDMALPIDCGQTTPRPVLIATMLQALDCRPDSRVLEVGSGSGYVTALLATLAASVRGCERFRSLADAAEGRLRALGLDRASIAWADGLAPQADTFDRIVLHAAVPAPPSGLIDRLNPGGILVCPVTAFGRQMLVRLTRETPEVCERLVPCDLPMARTGLARAL